MDWIKLLYPGINIKRWVLLLFLSMASVMLGLFLLGSKQFQNTIGETLFFAKLFSVVDFQGNAFLFAGVFFIIIGFYLTFFAMGGFLKSMADIFIVDHEQTIIDIIFSKRRLVKGASVTVIGGGTGLSSLLRGIKQITGNCTAVVATTDDGGSSGRLREEFGMIPPGDLRNCITALADTEPLMADLMQYRFEEGSSLSGHSFGNLFIAAMANIVGDMEKGLKATNKILKVRGNVMAATLESVSLIAKMSDGSFVKGESSITAAGKKIEKIMMEPVNAVATRSSVEAILGADMLVFGPGSLYTSVITNLLIPEIKEAVLQSKAVKIYVCNVMTQPGETDGYSAYDHLRAIYEHVGEAFFNFIIVNKQQVGQSLLEKYSQQGAHPVNADVELLEATGINVIEANLISEEDLVRHDSVKLAQTLIALMYRLRLSNKGIKLFDYYFTKDSMRKVKKNL